MFKQVVPCTRCSQLTENLATKLCVRCWELNTYFDSLLRDNRFAAEQWLQDRAADMGGGLDF